MSKIFARVKTEEQLAAVLDCGRADCVIADYAIAGEALKKAEAAVGAEKESVGFEKAADIPELYLALPDVAREGKDAQMKELAEMLCRSAVSAPENNASEKGNDTAEAEINATEDIKPAGGFTGAAVKNIDEIGMLKEAGYKGKVIGDSFLYVYNREAAAFFLGEFPDMRFIFSDELTDDELAKLCEAAGGTGRFIYKIYGHQPLMITKQCLAKNYDNCHGPRHDFRDEKGNGFIAVTSCAQCYSIVYGGEPVSMLDKKDEIRAKFGDIDLLYDFTVESGPEAAGILTGKLKPEKISRGHHYRGID